MPRATIATPAPVSTSPPRFSQAELLELERINARMDELLYQARIDKYGTDPLMRFCLSYLQHHMVHQDGPRKGQFCPPCPKHQELTAAAYAIVTSADPDPRLAAEAFRGFGKSTYLTTGLSLMCICELDKHNIVIISQTKGECKDRIANIVEELETNERLRTDYPQLGFARDLKNQTKAYTDYQIILQTGPGSYAAIKAYEFGKGKLRGRNVFKHRVDLIILDDPEHDDLRYSPIMRQRYWSWLLHVCLPAMSDYGAIIWAGTPVGADGLLLKARRAKDDHADPGLGWPGPFIPLAEEIEVRGGDGVAQPRWRSNWPERYSEADVIRKLASTDDPAIAREDYLLIPRCAGDQPFDLAWYDDNLYDPAQLAYVNGHWEYEGRPVLEVRSWIDSAISTSPTADYTAIVTGGRMANDDVLIFELIHGRFKVPDQLDLLRSVNERWHPQRIGGQKSQLEEGLSQFASRECYLPLELETMNTTAGAKDKRLRSGTVYYRNGKVKHAAGDRVQLRVRSEMKTYPGGHDDALDAEERLLNSFLASPANAGGEGELGEARESYGATRGF